MPLRFHGDGLLKNPFQIFPVASVSEWRLDVYFIISKKTRTEPAVCGEPETITRRAEVVAHCTDETDFPSG
jgi:hypothetical protein